MVGSCCGKHRRTFTRLLSLANVRGLHSPFTLPSLSAGLVSLTRTARRGRAAAERRPSRRWRPPAPPVTRWGDWRRPHRLAAPPHPRARGRTSLAPWTRRSRRGRTTPRRSSRCSWTTRRRSSERSRRTSPPGVTPAPRLQGGGTRIGGAPTRRGASGARAHAPATATGGRDGRRSGAASSRRGAGGTRARARAMGADPARARAPGAGRRHAIATGGGHARAPAPGGGLVRVRARARATGTGSSVPGTAHAPTAATRRTSAAGPGGAPVTAGADAAAPAATTVAARAAPSVDPPGSVQRSRGLRRRRRRRRSRRGARARAGAAALRRRPGARGLLPLGLRPHPSLGRRTTSPPSCRNAARLANASKLSRNSRTRGCTRRRPQQQSMR
jgi:hypothetical protein